MSKKSLTRLITRTGRITEAAPPAPARAAGTERFHGSVGVRFINAGGCSDCALELASAFGPVYDVEQYGIRLVASPRHADVLLITGSVTHNMLEPLRRTIEATPEPRFIIAVGDCAIDGGVTRDGYGVVGPVSSVVDVDLTVPGAPPEPELIVEALRRMTGR